MGTTDRRAGSRLPSIKQRAGRPESRVMHRVMRCLSSRYEIDRFVNTHGPDPFRILIGCVISLRTKDDVSYAATDRLFQRASRPEQMLRLRAPTIAKLIYPAGFYRRKAEQINRIERYR